MQKLPVASVCRFLSSPTISLRYCVLHVIDALIDLSFSIECGKMHTLRILDSVTEERETAHMHTQEYPETDSHQ